MTAVRRRRRVRPAWATEEPQPGMAARLDTDCARCPEPIHKGDRYVFHRGRAIHVRCASGGDDE